MSGRGDNNKNGSAGRGARNQSNQAFIADDQNQPKSDHKKNVAPGKPSKPQRKSIDPSGDRNSAHRE
jgi:hypothetical protein